MNTDDIIYLSLLIFSIGFGYYYRRIKDVDSRKNIGTLVGLVIIFIVSGFHIIHTFLTIFINACIILFIDKRKCHVVSFIFSFLYLFFFRSTVYFGIPYPPSHTNLVQMMLTLKLVGLAMEVNTSYTTKKKNDTAVKTTEEILENETFEFQLNFVDVFHYSLNYVGVLTGPYYRYRTFIDSFNTPFSNYDDWKSITLHKLKYIPFFAVGFLWGSYQWPLSYASSDEFYNECSWLYRYWYIWPTFFIFRMRIYIGLVLSECVCTMAGLGVYPTFTKPKPGRGPSENFKKLKALESANELRDTEYDYQTIYNINPYGSEFTFTYRETMKHWNICIQYWLAVNVYKRFPMKKFRTVATMMVSAVWHGVYTGYYVCIGTVPFVLPIEDVWMKLIKDKKGLPIQVIYWFFRMQMFSYQGIAFNLLELGLILKYYNSIYHVVLIVYIALYMLGVYLLKARRSNKIKTESIAEQREQVKDNKIN